MSNLKLYFAPLEGVAGYIFRNVFHRHFKGVDVYFAPFISPAKEKNMTPREKRDIAPENNQGMIVIPQILTGRADYFIKAEKQLLDLGYTHINMNLGCPSGTVVAKNKGAGLLRDSEFLKRLLDEIFDKTQANISLKTRIGFDDLEDFDELLQVFNQFPLEELIVHPRLQTEFYKGSVHHEEFEKAVAVSKNTLCYNGDITTLVEYKKIRETYPEVFHIMIGRGLIGNPFLMEEILADREFSWEEKKPRLKAYLVDLLVSYRENFSGDKPVLFKMKEIWIYLYKIVPNGEKILKEVKKAKNLTQYESIISRIM